MKSSFFYCQLFVENNRLNINLSKIFAFGTHFNSTLVTKGFRGVANWTKKVDFSQDFIFIPIYLEVHWCLALVDIKYLCINYYDTLYGKSIIVLDYCVHICKRNLKLIKTKNSTLLVLTNTLSPWSPSNQMMLIVVSMHVSLLTCVKNLVPTTCFWGLK